MKTKLQILSVALLGIILTSCSSSMNMSKSSGNSSDDIYYTPSKTQVSNISEKNQDIKRVDDTNQKQNEFAQLEDKYKKILASDSTNIDTVIYKAESSNPYERILSDSYQESYERRLKGMQDPSYRLEGLSTYYSSDYFNATTYDPAFYNVVVMGNQVWVEPWYISRMFSWPQYHLNFGLGFEFGYGNWNPWYSYNYPYYNLNSWYIWNPYSLWGYYKYSDFNYNYNNYYYGPRSGNTSSSISNRLRGDNSFENQIASSRRRDGLNTNPRGNNLDTRTRNVNQTDYTRSGYRNSNQEITRRGNRSGDLSTTRLREGSGSTRNTSLAEPTRRNNNSYQRPRSSSNDGYIRTGTRNQNTDATNRNNNNSRDNSNVREGRNTTPTYNRPNRVDSSTERSRNSNAGSSNGSSNRETNYRNSGGSSSSGNTPTRTSTGSSSNSNQSNSSGGSNTRRR